MDAYLQRLHAAIAGATQDMTAEQLARHAEGKWSAAEILEHLYYTYTGTIKVMQLCLKAGKPDARTPTLKERLQIFWVVEAGMFPTGREAPNGTRPRGMSVEEVLQQIGTKIIVMDDVITQCEARFGKRTLIRDHPILGPLTCRQWRKLHWLHGRHHVKQLARLRETRPER
jgi:hypothetical protein